MNIENKLNDLNSNLTKNLYSRFWNWKCRIRKGITLDDIGIEEEEIDMYVILLGLGNPHIRWSAE